MRDNFISTIVNFDTDDVTDEVRNKMKKYLENPDYNFEKVRYNLKLKKKNLHVNKIKNLLPALTNTFLCLLFKSVPVFIFVF